MHCLFSDVSKKHSFVLVCLKVKTFFCANVLDINFSRQHFEIVFHFFPGHALTFHANPDLYFMI